MKRDPIRELQAHHDAAMKKPFRIVGKDRVIGSIALTRWAAAALLAWPTIRDALEFHAKAHPKKRRRR